jgi:biotin operon repressor
MEAQGKDEQIGFHKGCLSTLAKERQEMGRILQIVDQLMQMHVNALKELGIDIEQQAADMTKEKPVEKPKKPIDDLL